MRLTTSGTFLHGNYWYNKGNPPFGRQGTSHGCVGLADVQGAQGRHAGQVVLRQLARRGRRDREELPDTTVAPDNGLNGWNMSWSAWTAGSAV